MEKRHGRPLLVTLAAAAVLFLGAGYVLQFGQAVSRYSVLRLIPMSVPAWYLPLAGAFWAGLWLTLGISLLRGREWARRLILIAIPLQVGTWLADWWLFSRSTIAIQSFGFDLGVRLMAAILGIVILLRAGRWTRGEIVPIAAVQNSEREKSTTHVE